MQKILYIVTNYYGNGWYCGFNPPFSDRIYYREQTIIINRLIKITNEKDNCICTIKLHPNSEAHSEDPPWIQNIIENKKFKLVKYQNIADLYSINDIVIIDSPTTTLLQAITTKLPVFAISSVISPPKSHIHILEKRVVLGDNSESLMDKLENYLNTNFYDADTNNRDYLKLYGTYIDDGKSLDRVKLILKTVLAQLHE